MSESKQPCQHTRVQRLATCDGVWRAVCLDCRAKLKREPGGPLETITAQVAAEELQEAGRALRSEQPELVDHPAHYGGGVDDPYEAIKIIEAAGHLEGFCKGSAIKYLLRAGKKASEPEGRDLDKAEWYIRYWRQRLPDDKT